MSTAPDFKFTPEGINEISRSAFARFGNELKAMLAVPASERTFENTVLSFCAARDHLADACEIPMLLGIVSPSAAIRKAAEKLKLKHGQHEVELFCREDVYRALREFADKKGPLAPLERRLLAKLMDDFRKNGLGLTREKGRAVKACLKELVALGLEFSRNIRENNDFVEITRAETAGLPGYFVSGLRRTVNGKYRVPMEFSDYVTLMENADDPAVRRRIYRAYFSKCAGSNTKLLERALVLRRKVARHMGYATFADYITRDRMAKNGANVIAFLERLKTPLQRKLRKVLKRVFSVSSG